jgi:4-hydroxy-3-polyprenylbenzoate decarboxylase
MYAERLIEVLMGMVPRVYLVMTETALKVARHELRDRQDQSFSLVRVMKGSMTDREKEVLRIFKHDDFFAPVASGSSAPTAMVVVPCSMGTLSRIAQGNSSNLLERAADVMLKQKRPLIVSPRETPLSPIHLRNMLCLAELGAHIVPAMPGFYQKPQTIQDVVDFVVGRLIECLGLEHHLYTPWNARMR